MLVVTHAVVVFFSILDRVVLVCCMQEHTRVSEKRSQRQFPNPVLAYVTPWCAISAILCMLVVFAFINGYDTCTVALSKYVTAFLNQLTSKWFSGRLDFIGY